MYDTCIDPLRLVLLVPFFSLMSPLIDDVIHSFVPSQTIHHDTSTYLYPTAVAVTVTVFVVGDGDGDGNAAVSIRDDIYLLCVVCCVPC